MTTRRNSKHDSSSSKRPKGKNVKWKWVRCSRRGGVFSRERRSSFSLEIEEIGPLDFDGAGRENVLREAGYAWTPDLRVLTNSKR